VLHAAFYVLNETTALSLYGFLKPKTFEEVRRVEKKVAEEKIQRVLEELLGKLE